MDVRLASSVANEDPTQTARQPMDGTDKTTESSCEKEQSSKTKDDVDTTRFSTKTGSLKELGCKLATNRFVMLILLLITISLIVTVIVKVLPFIFLHNVEPTPSSELTDDYE